MNWYLKVLRQYADFSGIARRKEYWMFVLFNFIAIDSIIDAILHDSSKTGLKTICENAFCNCRGLTSVTNLNIVLQRINSNVFNNVTLNNVTLYVPSELVAAYTMPPIYGRSSKRFFHTFSAIELQERRK